jgi:hypothetical protein
MPFPIMKFIPARADSGPAQGTLLRCRHHAPRIVGMVRVLYAVVPTQGWVTDVHSGSTHLLQTSDYRCFLLTGLRVPREGYVGINLWHSNFQRQRLGKPIFQARNMSQLLVMAQMLESLAMPETAGEDEDA